MTILIELLLSNSARQTTGDENKNKRICEFQVSFFLGMLSDRHCILMQRLQA